MIKTSALKIAFCISLLTHGLADSGWDVKGYTPKVEAALPPGYKLDSKGKVLRK